MSLGVDLVLAGFAAGLLVLLATIDTAYGLISDVSLHILRGGRSERRVAFFGELMEHQERFRMALQLGIQVAAIALTAIAVHASQQFGIRHPVLVGFLAALVVVIFCRLLFPRLVAQNTPERVLMGLLPIFRPFYRLASFVVVPLSALYGMFRRKAPAEVEGDDERLDETMSDIQALIDVAEEEGIIEGGEGALIQSIVELAETHVHEVMTPRTNVVAVSTEATILEARDLMIATKHSRLPVYAEQIDNVEGVLHVRDVLAAWAAGGERETVPSVMRPVYFVPEIKPVGDLLEEMRKSQVQIAMVIDEYGAVAGLVTIEDLLEEIVGEIEDEDVDTGEDDEMVAQDDGAVVVKGSIEIRKVELQFDTELEADDFTTIAGLIINELGHLPSRGERLEFKGFEFEVLEADNRRVNLVRLRPLAPDQPQEAAPQG